MSPLGSLRIHDLKLSRSERMRSWTRAASCSFKQGYGIGYLSREKWWWIFPEYQKWTVVRAHCLDLSESQDCASAR